MKLIISNSSMVPIYEQIVEQIKAAIVSGELQAQEMLPSVRSLAKDLKMPFETEEEKTAYLTKVAKTLIQL